MCSFCCCWVSSIIWQICCIFASSSRSFSQRLQPTANVLSNMMKTGNSFFSLLPIVIARIFFIISKKKFKTKFQFFGSRFHQSLTRRLIYFIFLGRCSCAGVFRVSLNGWINRTVSQSVTLRQIVVIERWWRVSGCSFINWIEIEDARWESSDV